MFVRNRKTNINELEHEIPDIEQIARRLQKMAEDKDAVLKQQPIFNFKNKSPCGKCEFRRRSTVKFFTIMAIIICAVIITTICAVWCVVFMNKQ